MQGKPQGPSTMLLRLSLGCASPARRLAAPPFTPLNRAEISAFAAPSGLEVLLRRRNLIPAAPGAVSSSGILTAFPFGASGAARRHSPRLTYLRLPLGSAHPQLNAIFEVPLSTSAVKALTSLITTTIKICTRGASRPPHGHPSTAASASLYSRGRAPCRPRRRISTRLSAIHFQGT